MPLFHIPYVGLQLMQPIHKFLKGQGVSINEMSHHVLVVIGFVKSQHFTSWTKADLLWVVFIVVNISQMIEFASMFHYGVKQINILQCLFPIFRTLQFLQVVQVPAHSSCPWVVFLQFFIE